MSMLIELMNHCGNHFVAAEYRNYHASIEGGVLTSDAEVIAGQYIIVSGSILNDGLYKVASVAGFAATLDGETENEEFDGTIYTLRVPKAFVALASEIESWKTAHPVSDLASESFPVGYSYSKAGGGVGGWRTAFSGVIARYMRPVNDVEGAL